MFCDNDIFSDDLQTDVVIATETTEDAQLIELDHNYKTYQGSPHDQL